MSTRNTLKFLYPIKWIGNWKYPATPSFRVIWTVWQWRVKRRNNILFRTPTSINCCSCCYLGGCLATRSRCSFFVFCCCECVPTIPVTFTRVLRVKQRCAHLLNAANERRKKTWNTKRQMWIGSQPPSPPPHSWRPIENNLSTRISVLIYFLNDDGDNLSDNSSKPRKYCITTLPNGWISY